MPSYPPTSRSRCSIRRRFSAFAALALALLARPSLAQHEPLLEGVESIAAPGLPGPVAVFGHGAFAVVTPQPAQAVVAAAGWGKGRVVVFGHGGMLTATSGDSTVLLANAAHWAAGGRDEIRVWGASAALRRGVDRYGYELLSADGDWREALGSIDLLVLDTHQLKTEADRELVREFVAGGGGWITAGLAWGWLQLNPGKTIHEHPGNLVLTEMGLAFADGTVSEDEGDKYLVDAEPSRWAHAGRSLDALAEGALSPDEQAAAGASVAAVLRTLGAGANPLSARLDELLDRDAASYDELFKNMHANGLTWKQHALARLAIERFMLESFDAPPMEVVKHPSADGFPGTIELAEGESLDRWPHLVRIDTTIPGWRCTGMYAPAGTVVAVSVDAGLAEAGLVVQIGAHLDPESRGELNRLPRVVRRFDITSESTLIANPVGGLIYLDVPKGFERESVDLAFSGAVTAPLFTLGVTTPEQWAEQRLAPGPWAELETRDFAITVPSALVRELDDPAALMEFWAEVVRTQGSLEPRKATGMSDRQARFVPDVSVSWGYMYAPANRPLTVPLHTAKNMLDLNVLRKQEGGNVWGFFHELGHWHQNAMWTFAGTGEVTVNIFTLYALDKVCGLPPAEARGFTHERMLSDMRAHVEAGSPFDVWKRKPFLALAMYVQLQQAFGWELYEDVFAEYRALPEAERPKTDDEKRDQWLVRTSRTAGVNLGPFFVAWGVPTSEEARASVSELPAWMPEGWE